eukprot:354508-Chlamydomonas_euryale.AAC.1
MLLRTRSAPRSSSSAASPDECSGTTISGATRSTSSSSSMHAWPSGPMTWPVGVMYAGDCCGCGCGCRCEPLAWEPSAFGEGAGCAHAGSASGGGLIAKRPPIHCDSSSTKRCRKTRRTPARRAATLM